MSTYTIDKRPYTTDKRPCTINPVQRPSPIQWNKLRLLEKQILPMRYKSDGNKFKQSASAAFFVIFLGVYSVWNTCRNLDHSVIHSHHNGHSGVIQKNDWSDYTGHRMNIQNFEPTPSFQVGDIIYAKPLHVSHYDFPEYDSRYGESSMESSLHSTPPDISYASANAEADENIFLDYVDKFDLFHLTMSNSNNERGKSGHVQNDLIEPSSSFWQASQSPPISSDLDTENEQLKPPPGFPFHRWGDWKSSIESSLSSRSAVKTFNMPNHTIEILEQSNNYPLNIPKFLSILSRHGQKKGVSTNFKQLLRKHNKNDFSRPFLSGKVKVFIFRNGTLLCENGESEYWDNYRKTARGYHIDWYHLAMNALTMAKALENSIPQMKILTEGDFPVIFDTSDYPWCSTDLVPVFRTNLMADVRKCNYAWPGLGILNLNLTASSHEELKNHEQDWHDEFEEKEKKYPWASKISQLVWRGRLTGYPKLFPDEETPRLKLHRRKHQSPHFMDVQFLPMSPYPHRNRGPVHHTNELYRMDTEKFMKYKAVLDIDGYAWSSRFGNLLCMNSVVVKVEPHFINYFENELVPWVDYIPVKPDLSDLDEVVEMVMREENEEWMKEVVKNSNEFCSKKFTYDQVTLDFLWTLLSYAELIQYAPGFYEMWANNYDAYHLPALKMAPHPR